MNQSASLEYLHLESLNLPDSADDCLGELFGKLRRLGDGTITGNWHGCQLSSVFQPVIDGVGGKTVAHDIEMMAGRYNPEIFMSFY